MLGSTVLEVAIGLIFIYLLMSSFCSAIAEYVEAKLNHRAKDLQKGIRMLLNDDAGSGLAKDLYTHPLVKSLYRDEKLPSYIPSRTFALALWDMAFPADKRAVVLAGANQLQAIRATVMGIGNEDVRKALLALIDDAGDDIEKARANIEEWYDSAMDRVSGWYKRRVQIALLVIGIVVSGLVNVDTITITRALVQDDTLRTALAASAEKAAAAPAPTPAPGTPDDPQAQARAAAQRARDIRTQLNTLGLPIGWRRTDDRTDPRRVPDTPGGWLLKLLGVFLTGLAITQGAPFWFDLLNKVIVIRSTVKPREKSPPQPSKDKPAPETEKEEEEGGKS